MMAVSPLGCPSIMDQSFVINVTPTSDHTHIHTHTHTQRDRERERERDCSWMKSQLKPSRLSQKNAINSSTAWRWSTLKCDTKPNPTQFRIISTLSDRLAIAHSTGGVKRPSNNDSPGHFTSLPSSYLHPRNCCSNVHFFVVLWHHRSVVA